MDQTVDLTNCLRRFTRAAATLPSRPTGLEGRGVLICAGGPKYFPCLWVCVHMLRRTGCALPVEVWHLGPTEVHDRWRRWLAPLGATFVDAHAVADAAGAARPPGGFELKPFALLHTRFAEVLLLDADNVPAIDPTYLFDSRAYAKTGALFWPDLGRFGSDHPIWYLAGVPYRDEPEFESGQLVVDKVRRWPELALTWWLNEHSYFWYQHVYGDKDTFRLAWRRLGMPYTMAPPLRSLAQGVSCQHDPEDGRLLFQHRSGAKWVLPPEQALRIPGYVDEDVCLGFLHDLQRREVDDLLHRLQASALAAPTPSASEKRGGDREPGRLAVVIPATFDALGVLEAFCRNLRTYGHPAVGQVFVVCNRPGPAGAADLQNVLAAHCPAPLRLVREPERSVAGAWNRGLELAFAAGFDLVLITAVDVAFADGMLDAMLAYGERHPGADLWSSTGDGELAGEAAAGIEAVDQCDFACVMLRRSTVERHGWFDPEYDPAYYEDTDYLFRVVLGGGRPRQLPGARHAHARNMTIRLDPGAAERVRRRHDLNRRRCEAKWGATPTDLADVRRVCLASPYGSGQPLSWWPEQDRPGYSPSGPASEMTASGRQCGKLQVFVINRDRLTTLRAMVGWLSQFDVEVVVLDNDSTYPPLLEWYRTAPVEVVRFNRNFGHTVGWDTGYLGRVARGPFVLTDSDLDLSGVPHDWAAVLARGLAAHGWAGKAGLSLEAGDLPAHYRFAAAVRNWEARFWERPLDGQFYEADVDTTFALYRPEHALRCPPHAAVRAARPYTAKHVPWYADSHRPTDEERYYLERASAPTNWTSRARALLVAGPEGKWGPPDRLAPPPGRSAFVFASYVPNAAALAVGREFLDLFARAFADCDVYVGVNHGSVPEWAELLRSRAGGLRLTVREVAPGMTVDSDASAFQAALGLLARSGLRYETVWFGHTKGATNPNSHQVRREVVAGFLGDRRRVEDEFARDPRLGAYGRWATLGEGAVDRGLDGLYPFPLPRVGPYFLHTFYAMRGSVVANFLEGCRPAFLTENLVTSLGLDRYFFERDFPAVAEKMGYDFGFDEAVRHPCFDVPVDAATIADLKSKWAARAAPGPSRDRNRGAAEPG